jgi:hypothetical protein
MNDDLRPDPAALEAWEKLPKAAPSSGALPPMTGGLRWTAVMLGLLLVMMAAAWLLNSR